MKKLLLLVMILASLNYIFAAATVKEVVGKVKVKFDGDTTWSGVSIGQELPTNTLISTGFNSQVVLDLGSSTLEISPLTRMTINELSESQDTVKTSLFLQGGKIKADVGKIEGKSTDFMIKSPVATASVRGTAFVFTGNTLTVFRGEVSMKPTKKSERRGGVKAEEVKEEAEDELEAEAEEILPEIFVKAGGESYMSTPGAAPVNPVAVKVGKSVVKTSTKPESVINKAPSGSPVVPDGEVPTAAEVVEQISGVTRIEIIITPVE